MNRIKLFYPHSLFCPDERAMWFELIKSKERSERKGSEVDLTLQKFICWVNDESVADAWILPMDWSYYYKIGKVKEAIAFCTLAQSKSKPVLSAFGGDYGGTPNVPTNVLIYRMAGYRSMLKPNHKTMPFFLSDPIDKTFQISEHKLYLRKESPQPLVGFCGMAPSGIKIYAREWLVVALHNRRSDEKRNGMEKQEVLSSSNLRSKVLAVFDRDSRFKTNYIRHQKYRAGVSNQVQREKFTKLFYKNILESDATICVRGAGNFSVRFYETLAMGRIPVFVDTDCPLPDIGANNWNDYVIWVDRKDVKQAPAIAEQWLKEKDLPTQFKKSRELWKTYFRLDGFWLNELKKLQK